MEKKKIYVLMGNPDMDSLTERLTDAYESAARAVGHEVRRQNLPEMHFDPVLHKGYKVIQELEPDLKVFQENVQWCDHFVIIYPNWWCTMPALLKGVFDRAWLPGFAFNMHRENLYGWVMRLKGRSARIIILADIPGWFTWLLFGEFTNELSRGILGFAGVQPVKTTVFSPSERSSDQKRAEWVRAVEKLGT
ncbi:MAG: NAD(P)H-dependent oxidoreductase, partial [Patescibacteria group bacterium]